MTTVSCTITLLLFSLLEVIRDFYCAPASIAIGFDTGVKNELNLTFGSIGLTDPEGRSANGDIKAKWNGSSHSNSYTAVNNIYIAHKNESTKTLDGTIKSNSISSLLNKINLLSLQPSLDFIEKSVVTEKSEFLFGESAKRLAASMGELGRYSGQRGIHSKSTAWSIFEYLVTFYVRHYFVKDYLS